MPINCIAICLFKAIYYSFLKFISKSDKTFYYIYNLFLLKSCRGLFINAVILKAYSTLTYSIVDDILILIFFTKREAVILKRDFKDAFWNILVAITN